MNKTIFIDLDETLIHTSLEPDTKSKEVVVNIMPPPHKPENYNVMVRPGANKLLFALREIGNVYMLTRAVRSYAHAMNKTFKFGFTTDRIFARQDLRSSKYKPRTYHQAKFFLIDDLDIRSNFEKIHFISPQGPVRYIRIEAFYGGDNEGITDEMIADIVKTIETA